MSVRSTARLFVVSTTVVLGLLAGCTSHTTQCSTSSCTVHLTGAQDVDVDPFGDGETDLRVGPIEPGAVTLSGYGETVRLTPGDGVRVAGLRVELVSVSGEDVSLRVEAA